jgi:phospholipase C
MPMSAKDDPIKHVIVLMLENRSFDQLLGACQKFYDDLDGVDPLKKPRVNWDDKGKPYEQLPDASYYIKDDPHHSLKSVLKQVGID